MYNLTNDFDAGRDLPPLPIRDTLMELPLDASDNNRMRQLKQHEWCYASHSTEPLSHGTRTTRSLKRRSSSDTTLYDPTNNQLPAPGTGGDIPPLPTSEMLTERCLAISNMDRVLELKQHDRMNVSHSSDYLPHSTGVDPSAKRRSSSETTVYDPTSNPIPASDAWRDLPPLPVIDMLAGEQDQSNGAAEV